MALIQLEGASRGLGAQGLSGFDYGGSGRFGEGLGRGSAVLRGCLGRGRDHQKLETKPDHSKISTKTKNPSF